MHSSATNLRFSRRQVLRTLSWTLLGVPLVAPRPVSAQATPTPPRTTSTPTPSRPTATPPPQPPPTAVPTAVPTRVPAWVQALLPLTLWSGPDEAAEPLGSAARWDYFL